MVSLKVYLTVSEKVWIIVLHIGSDSCSDNDSYNDDDDHINSIATVNVQVW